MVFVLGVPCEPMVILLQVDTHSDFKRFGTSVFLLPSPSLPPLCLRCPLQRVYNSSTMVSEKNCGWQSAFGVFDFFEGQN